MAARRRLLLGLAGLGLTTTVLGSAAALGWPPLRRTLGWGGLTGGLAGGPADEVCRFAPALPYEPASGLHPAAARPVPAHARCPVCGMFPARSPAWAAQALYRDGAAHFFDGPLSLHLYLLDVPRYAPGRQRRDIAALYLHDAERGDWIAAARAFHVHGSDLPGPMRTADLPAFVSAEGAQRFATRHGGRVLPFAAVDGPLLATLDRRSGHDHRATASGPGVAG